MTNSRLSACLIAAILAGCGQSQPILSPKAPHGGMVFDLPDGRGMVEVVRQEVSDKPGQIRLVVYSLDAKMNPMAPGLTTATLKTRGQGGKSVDFKPNADTDPSKAGGLATAPFADPGEVAGELSTTIDGKPVLLSISVR